MRYVSPWLDGTQDTQGNWLLPEYPCEIQDLPEDHPKNKKWIPGEWQPGIDNVDQDANQVLEWGGRKLWEGAQSGTRSQIGQYSERVQRLLKIPHLPGQPTKEMFARMKAYDPRPFQDPHWDKIHRNLPEDWETAIQSIKWAETFGIHSEEEPAEWKGLEDELVPAVYPTPRIDAVQICVGGTGEESQDHDDRMDLLVSLGAEYDYLEWLYAKDHEDKIIQLMHFPSAGISRNVFSQYSFIPPKGTLTITPYACFKIKGVWRGPSLAWDPTVSNEDMQWFTDMPPELRVVLADGEKLGGKEKRQVDALRYPKNRKFEPVLWPENSWEGNAAKARMWGQ